MNLLNSGQDFINLTGDTSCSSWGSSFFSLSETLPKVISYIYIYKYYSNVTLFETRRPGTFLGTHKISPKMTSSYIFVAFINIS